MEMHEVEHRAVDRPVDRVADRAPDDEAERGGQEPRSGAAHPQAQPERGGDRERDEQPAAEIALLLEQAVGDAPIPDHDDIGERPEPPRLGHHQIRAEIEPELGGLVERERQERGGEPEAEGRHVSAIPSPCARGEGMLKPPITPPPDAPHPIRAAPWRRAG